jgi:hypothetical protein
MTIAVLIVEDEFLLRMDATSFIEDAGFAVYGVTRRFVQNRTLSGQGLEH